MIRTQIYIPEDIYRELNLLAHTSKTNLSVLIREGAREIIRKNKKTKKNVKNWGKTFFGALHTGPKNLSQKINEIYK